MERDTELLLRVARIYYIQSETTEAIVHHMEVFRSAMSRLLKEAKDWGLVRVAITDPDRPITRLAEIFHRNFYAQAHLANVRPGPSHVLWLEQVAKVVARLLNEIVADNDVVGMAWRTTVSAVAQHLRPRDLSGMAVMSLNSGANHRTTGLPYVGSILQCFVAAFHGEEQFLALPVFFDNPRTRTAMWAERFTRHTFQVWVSCTKVIFGVGGLGADLQLYVYSTNYLDDSEPACLKSRGVVGDVCTVMLRTDGSWRDLPINSHATGMIPAELRTTLRRICVVSGTDKVVSVLGVSRTGVATGLAIDEETARAVSHEIRPGLHSGQIPRTVDSRFWFGCVS